MYTLHRLKYSALKYQDQHHCSNLFLKNAIRAMSSIKHQVGEYDLVVIGSGPSAIQCALESAKRGKKVAIVDKKDSVGGVCVHTGTIPSKTFREAVLHLSGYRHHG
jgi:ribulose 1,5-bisphosphate synthetase/thiazole synthase